MVHSKAYRQYLNIWIILMVLTVITIGAAQFNFGALNAPIALIIASIKAGAVALYFMHLKYEDNMTWVFIIFPLVLLFIFIGFSAGDVFTRILN